MTIINIATEAKQDQILSNFPIKIGTRLFEANGSFVVPEGIDVILVTACGGGGGGGGSNSTTTTAIHGGGGGGGACIVRTPFTVLPGQAIAITIGAGGVGNAINGTAGGTTVLSGIVSLPGGEGGKRGHYPGALASNPGGAGGGFGARGYYSVSGNMISTSNGGDGIISSGGTFSTNAGGGGGGSFGGGGGGGNSRSDYYNITYGGQPLTGAPLSKGAATGNNSANGFGGNGIYGGGGGGGSGYNTSGVMTNYKGGDGGKGIVIIEW